MRKDIENLHTILLAIKRVENTEAASSIQHAENLDTLYSALKTQCEAVVEIQQLEEINDGTQH